MKHKDSAELHVEEHPIIQSIRRGLVMTIPALMIGSFALILNVLPIPVYQQFITTFASGFLSNAFTYINKVTFGILSLGITICVSVSYVRLKTVQTSLIMGGVFASIASFMILNGLFTDSFQLASFGAQGMFTALFTAVASSMLFCRLVQSECFSLRMYTVGADADFNNTISVIFPALIVVVSAFLLNYGITVLFGVSSFEGMFHLAINAVFNLLSTDFQKSLLFVVLTNLFWFFGVHGTNVMDSVAQNIFFSQGADTVTLGFLTKPVIDSFVLMGGCGTTISLLVAILCFSKQKNTRSLAKMASFPMIFNINELMLFGLPIVLNLSFFLPFILVPLVCVATSILALSTGLVPLPTNPVEWVTPLIINGYQATGSIKGSLLQIFNIAIGALIYRYFLLRYEKRSGEQMRKNLGRLISVLQEAETNGSYVALLELRGNRGAIARMLAKDLQHLLKQQDGMELYYQSQYDRQGNCFGAEALLRWNHPICGCIYPPLIIGLAQESGQLDVLEHRVYEMAAQNIRNMLEQGVCPPHVSVNVTAATLQNHRFHVFLRNLILQYPELSGVLYIELTEQMSLSLSEKLETQLTDLKQMGIRFAVDDFSMGHTSVRYLQTNLFDLVKLDGSLTSDLLHNRRSQEIVSSIVQMGGAMGFSVLAEYVEVTEQRDLLDKLGCCLYQGYLYAPALSLTEFEELMKNPPRAADVPTA